MKMEDAEDRPACEVRAVCYRLLWNDYFFPSALIFVLFLFLEVNEFFLTLYVRV